MALLMASISGADQSPPPPLCSARFIGVAQARTCPQLLPQRGLQLSPETQLRLPVLVCLTRRSAGRSALQRGNGLLDQVGRGDLRVLPATGAMALLLPGRNEEAHLHCQRQGVITWLARAGGFVSTLGLTGQMAVQALESTFGPWKGEMAELATVLKALTDTHQHTRRSGDRPPPRGAGPLPKSEGHRDG